MSQKSLFNIASSMKLLASGLYEYLFKQQVIEAVRLNTEPKRKCFEAKLDIKSFFEEKIKFVLTIKNIMSLFLFFLSLTFFAIFVLIIEMLKECSKKKLQWKNFVLYFIRKMYFCLVL